MSCELKEILEKQRVLSEHGNNVESKIQSCKKQEPKVVTELDRKLGQQLQRIESSTNENSTNETRTVPEESLEGLIFDCDGTLVDTMPVYYESWCRLCAKHSLQLTEEEFYGFAGKFPSLINLESSCASHRSIQLL
jgi:hypothetical protein